MLLVDVGGTGVTVDDTEDSQSLTVEDDASAGVTEAFGDGEDSEDGGSGAIDSQSTTSSLVKVLLIVEDDAAGAGWTGGSEFITVSFQSPLSNQGSQGSSVVVVVVVLTVEAGGGSEGSFQLANMLVNHEALLFIEEVSLTKSYS